MGGDSHFLAVWRRHCAARRGMKSRNDRRSNSLFSQDIPDVDWSLETTRRRAEAWMGGQRWRIELTIQLFDTINFNLVALRLDFQIWLTELLLEFLTDVSSRSFLNEVL